ncbi:MAG: SpaA isopeptide-forming pilin-related protein, partial [Acidobacteriaceae bacterium]
VSTNTCTTGTVGGYCSVTFSSNSAGKTVGHASASILSGGLSLSRQTDGLAGNSGDATKTWVDAYITISPDDTNEVGDPHTFTVTVYENDGSGGGFKAAAGEHVDFTLTDSNGAVSVLNAASSTCDDAGANTNASGQCTIVFTSNSAGQVTGHASSSVSVGGLSLFRETDGTAPNSDNALKTFVDAYITISPSATNEVGAPHTFTVTVYEDDGSGSGFQPAAGEDVDFTLTGSNGAVAVLNATSSTCDDPGANTDASGQCTIVFTSNSAGKVTGHAASSVSVGGLSLLRETDGSAPNSGDAVKTFVDAYITISPDDTNEVGDPHTFTVTVYENDGSGGGFKAAAGEDVDFTLTDSNGAASVLNAASSTCDDAGANTNASGQCTIVFTSNSAGQVTGHASSNVSVGGLSLFRETDGTAPNSGDALKTFVDARISISPDGENGIGEDHTFGVLAEKNEGQGGGWVNADDGTIVAVTLTDSNGASSSVSTESCSTGTVNGLCSVTFSSSSAGTTKGHASATILSGGLGLFRETDGLAGNSGDATKIWVAGSLSWLKQDNLGNPLGGATFEVCRTLDRFGNDIPDECVTVLDNSAPDEDPAAGQFLLSGLALGTYTITETLPPAGYAGDSYVETLVLTLAAPNKSATHIWVNTPNQGCTPGFWQGGAGSLLWDQVNDPDWIYGGTNPYIHTTLFNDFFNVVTDPRLDGYSMYDLVSTGGGPDSAIKAARDMVAAYLNESAFPSGYPVASLQDLLNMWYNAVAGGDAALDAFHTLVSGWNSPVSGYCPLP